jgi:hypothetical protein
MSGQKGPLPWRCRGSEFTIFFATVLLTDDLVCEGCRGAWGAVCEGVRQTDVDAAGHESHDPFGPS